MKGKFLSFTLLLATILLFASCLGSDQDEVTYYGDTAITSFSLGTINQTVHTTKKYSDEDSTYTTTFDGSAYSLYIDQLNGLIYNADSLPCGADVSKLVITVGTKNSGVAVIKNVDNDSLKYVSSTDSLDFTTPRTMYVYAQNMQSGRKYEVTINVHKEIGDTLIWHEKSASTELGALNAMRLMENNNVLFAVGQQDDKTAIYATEDGDSWTLKSTLASADAYKGVITSGTTFYVYMDGKIMKSEDGCTWTEVATNDGISRLLGASRNAIYALGTDHKIFVSTDGGSTWTADNMEDNADLSLVPDEDISMITMPVKTNDNMYKVVLIGKCSNDAAPTEKVWTKIINESGDNHAFEWTFLPQEGNRYVAPQLAGFTAFGYDGGIAALGGNGENGSTATAFSQFYFSQDEGITWKSHTQMILPKNFESECNADNFAITADHANRIWIVSGTNGKVWCGRINRLGWARQD